MEEVYGVKIPFTVVQAYHLDKLNGNSLWKDAIDKEMNSLKMMECFKFKEPGLNLLMTIRKLHCAFTLK